MLHMTRWVIWAIKKHTIELSRDTTALDSRPKLNTMYGDHPRYLVQRRPEAVLPTPAVLKEFADSLSSLNDYLRSEMTWAQAEYSEQADKHRIPAPRLEAGDYVWLLRKNIRTTQPSNKSDFKRLGKFRIIQRVSSHAYKLELPASMKVHPVFHVSLLEPAATDPLPNQVQPPPPPVIVEEEEPECVRLPKMLNQQSLAYKTTWKSPAYRHRHPTIFDLGPGRIRQLIF